MSKRAKAALASGMGAVALASTYLIAPWEGMSTVPYRDIVGVLTVCYGETVGVRLGQRFTKADCDAKLKARVGPDYYEPLRRSIRGFDAAPVSLQASAISVAYNVGVSPVIRSQAARAITAGCYEDACRLLTNFDKARVFGVLKPVPGLTNRRTDGDASRMGEEELCLEGLK
jgi:GH24 family phage-related lysozyme (muramidase)